jgi:hypothetical protein
MKTITHQRVARARTAMHNAKNPVFKNYWRQVADTLAKYIDD